MTMATILVVDDHATNRQVLTALLGYGGHRLLEASDGLEALELERMGALVTNLLQSSRQSALQLSTVDVCGEIEKSLELIQYHLRKYGITVVREFVAEVLTLQA